MSEHSKYFQKVKDYYDKDLWKRQRVIEAVNRGWITEEEYYEIVGE